MAAKGLQPPSGAINSP